MWYIIKKFTFSIIHIIRIECTIADIVNVFKFIKMILCTTFGKFDKYMFIEDLNVNDDNENYKMLLVKLYCEKVKLFNSYESSFKNYINRTILFRYLDNSHIPNGCYVNLDNVNVMLKQNKYNLLIENANNDNITCNFDDEMNRRYLSNDIFTNFGLNQNIITWINPNSEMDFYGNINGSITFSVYDKYVYVNASNLVLISSYLKILYELCLKCFNNFIIYHDYDSIMKLCDNIPLLIGGSFNKGKLISYMHNWDGIFFNTSSDKIVMCKSKDEYYFYKYNNILYCALLNSDISKSLTFNDNNQRENKSFKDDKETASNDINFIHSGIKSFVININILNLFTKDFLFIINYYKSSCVILTDDEINEYINTKNISRLKPNYTEMFNNMTIDFKQFRIYMDTLKCDNFNDKNYKIDNKDGIYKNLNYESTFLLN